MRKRIFRGVLGLLMVVLATASGGNAFAAKLYGYYDPDSAFLYNQKSGWWNVGEGATGCKTNCSEKNGSAINAFAVALSVVSKKKITPAAVAKTAVEKGIWDLKGTPPSDLIKKLAQVYGNNKTVIAAGKNKKKRAAAIEKVFTKADKYVIIARATGSSPFNKTEKGGHYIVLLGYGKGKVYYYDPAKKSKGVVKKSVSSLLGKMKKNIMFYAISPVGAGDASAYFDTTEPEPEGDAEDDPEEQGVGGTEGGETGDEGGSGSGTGGESGGGSGTGSGTEPTSYGEVIAEKALDAAWPEDDGTCIGADGTTYNWLTMRDYCKTGVNAEYRAMLSAAGIGTDLASAQNPVNFIAAVIAASSDLGRIPSSAIKDVRALYDYFEAEAKKANSDWQKGNGIPAVGDVVYQGGQFYIYVGAERVLYGNAVTARIGEWVPYMDNISTSKSYTYYRVVKKYEGGGGSSGGGGTGSGTGGGSETGGESGGDSGTGSGEGGGERDPYAEILPGKEQMTLALKAVELANYDSKYPLMKSNGVPIRRQEAYMTSGSGYDCIGFVKAALKKAGFGDIATSSFGTLRSNLSNKKNGWMKMGGLVVVASEKSTVKSYATYLSDGKMYGYKTAAGNEADKFLLMPGDILVTTKAYGSAGQHTFIYVGSVGGTKGDRADSGNMRNMWVGASSHGYSKPMEIYRYVGK